MKKTILISILLSTFVTCQNVGPVDDGKMVFIFNLFSNFTSGNDTLQGYTTPASTAALDYAPNMWSHQHVLALRLSSFRTGATIFDTSVFVDTCHFAMVISDRIPSDTFLLYGTIYNDQQGLIAQVSPILVVKCTIANDTIASLIDSTQTVQDSLVFIGNPSRVRYPSNSSFDCQARTVWDMQLFDGEIFLGAGDVGENAGPVQVWSLLPSGSFKSRFTLNEEEISLLNVSDSSLLIPGIDPTGNPDHGNVYIYSNNQALSTLTIPNAIHVLDIVKYQSQIWSVIDFEGHLRFSSDTGRTWHSVLNAFPFYSSINRIVTVSNTLYFLGDISQGYCQFNNDSLIFIPSNLVPRKNWVGSASARRICNFKTGFAYSFLSLYYFDSNIQTAKLVTAFNGIDLQVQDIITRNDSIFVMATAASGSSYSCQILKSTDLANWKRICSFRTLALPVSMELMNEFFYIGLGNSGRYDFADSASGNIYKIKNP